MKITISMDEFKRAKRKAQIREWVQDKAQRMERFWNTNKNDILTYGPIIVGSLGAIARVVGKRISLKKEQDLKDLYCYDRSLGHYWSLRRELTNREWLEVDARRKNGERMADILKDMRVLK